MTTYRVFRDGVTQDAARERAPFVGIGPYVVVDAATAEEAVRLAAQMYLPKRDHFPAAYRSPPKFAVGDWAYNDLKGHNARIAHVHWDASLHGWYGGWRYAVPGLSDPDMRAPSPDKPYVEYALVEGRSDCWAPIEEKQA